MKKCIKYLVLIIMVVSVLSVSVSAAENSNAYISSGGAYIYRWGAGDISVEYHVFGTDIMDTLGAHRITVYKMKSTTPDSASDELVATYWYEDYPEMMSTDEFLYGGSIRLNVETGHRYYAVLVFYATLNGGGDDMAFCTDPAWA